MYSYFKENSGYIIGLTAMSVVTIYSFFQI